MTFDITKVPITVKLMLLRGGCTNFRSIGDEMVINYAENNSLLVCADANGSGKSSLFEHLPLFALTGRTSNKEDKVDALVNTQVGKKMEVFLEWYFTGTYYRVIRGRKPNRLDVYSLINGEWVEIPDLPVSSRDRQDFIFSILGLDKKTAVNVIENTMLLSGQRFKGFTSLSTPERRDLVEPILDLTIFSALNAETKSLRTGVVLEQKQTFLELNDVKLKVALAEQEVSHKKEDLISLEASYKERKEVLESHLSNHTLELKEASEVDTEGSELKDTTLAQVGTLKTQKEELASKLKSDLSNLGEFIVDEEDEVLVKLKADIKAIDTNLAKSKSDLESKRSTLSSCITEALEKIKSSMEDEKISYDKEVALLNKGHEESIVLAKEASDKAKKTFEEATTLYKENAELHDSYGTQLGATKETLEELYLKETQYKEKCTKLEEAVIYLEAKKEQENSNLEGLVHAGECPTCRQHISEDYIEGLKGDLEEKISEIQVDIDSYTKRISKGYSAIEGLNIKTLEEEFDQLTQKMNCVVPDLPGLHRVEDAYKGTKAALDNLLETDPTKDLSQEHKSTILSLQNDLDKAQSEITKELGDIEANYNVLLVNKPNQVANILQQREDRISSLKGEFGGKERHLQSVYDLTVSNVLDKIKNLEEGLEEQLAKLVTDKEANIALCESKVKTTKEEISTLTAKYEMSEEKATSAYEKALSKHLCEVSDLNVLTTLHDKQQQDIEDYNDLLSLLSDKEGKSDIIKLYTPQLNKNVNSYLESMSLFINLEIDNQFNLIMNSEDRKGQSLYSLSAGQIAKVDLAILFGLRDLAASKESVASNLLVLDEILDALSAEALQDVILMTQERFSHNNVVLITQRGEEVRDLFSAVKEYGLRGGFTVEIDNQD